MKTVKNLILPFLGKHIPIIKHAQSLFHIDSSAFRIKSAMIQSSTQDIQYLPAMTFNKLLLIFTLSLCVSVSTSSVLIAQQVSNEAQKALQSRGMTLSQIQQMAQAAGINPNDTQAILNLARAQGASAEELRLLEEELRKKSSQSYATNQFDFRSSFQSLPLDEPISTADSLLEEDLSQKIATDSAEDTIVENALPYFGYSIFSQNADRFDPSLNNAVSDSYVIGVEDELRLLIWGETEVEYQLSVNPQGNIIVPTIGPVLVSGKTLKDLREYLRKRLSDSFSGLIGDPPTTFLDVNVSRAQNIRVFVLGDVKQVGGYNLAFGADVFNALFIAGGPSYRGSLRDIRIIRDGKIIEHVDLYNLLIKGGTVNNIPLRTNDRILVPPRLSSIEINGAVKRPGIYELKENESINELLSYASGLATKADQNTYHIKRILSPENRVDGKIERFIDRSLTDDLISSSFTLQDGDQIYIDALYASFENYVEIAGGVYKAGTFELRDDVRTVRDLIIKADSITDNAYLNYASLSRIRPDSTLEQVRFNVKKALDGDPLHDLPLLPRDKIFIYTQSDIQNKYSVYYVDRNGNGSTFPWKEDLTVFDVLFQQDKLFDDQIRDSVFLQRADIKRLQDNGFSRYVIPFNLEEVLSGRGFADSTLQKGDIIQLYPTTVKRQIRQSIEINGFVKKTGSLPFVENMTLKDVLLSANGFKDEAYIAEIEISRISKDQKENKIVDRLNIPLYIASNNQVPFYNEILFDELIKQAETVEIKNRDKIYVRKHPNWKKVSKVTIVGEVNFPGEYTIEYEGETLSSLMKRAKGVTPEAYVRGARLIRDSSEVFIELDRIVSNQKEADIMLLDGDLLEIPKERFTVDIVGNVGQPGKIKYLKGKRISYYLNRAGGLLPNSYKYVQLTQGNGSTFRVKRKGLFKKNPKVEDHAIIRVIQEDRVDTKEKMTFREIVGETTAILTSTLTLILLLDQLNR